MKHEEFIEKYDSNKIKVDVDIYKLYFLSKEKDLLLQKFRREQINIKIIFFVGTVIGLISLFYIPWWIALIILLTSLFASVNAQNMVEERIIIASLNDSKVFDVVLTTNIFTIQSIEDNQ